MEEIENLLKLVDTEIKAAKKANEIFQESHAPLFRTFHFIEINENKLSEIFAFLLNPYETHGQGRKYLRKFLEMAFQLNSNFPVKNPDEAHSIAVNREVCTTGLRRADIVIAIDNFEIVVENKPWAPDGDNQVSDYSRYLKLERKEAVIVYIAQQDPTENSICIEELEKLKSDNKFFRISFDDISTWIKSCVQETKPEKVRSFLYEVNEFIEKEIMNTTAQPNQEVIQLINNNIASSFEIIKNFDLFKKERLEKFLNHLETVLDEKGLLIDYALIDKGTAYDKTKLLKFERYASFFFYRKETMYAQKRLGYAIRFSFETGDLKGLIWGVSKLNDQFDFSKKPELTGKIRDAMNKEFPKIEKLEENITPKTWWPWYANASTKDIPNDWGDDPEAWTRMDVKHSDSIVKILVEVALKSVEALEKIQVV